MDYLRAFLEPTVQAVRAVELRRNDRSTEWHIQQYRYDFGLFDEDLYLRPPFDYEDQLELLHELFDRDLGRLWIRLGGVPPVDYQYRDDWIVFWLERGVDSEVLGKAKDSKFDRTYRSLLRQLRWRPELKVRIY